MPNVAESPTHLANQSFPPLPGQPDLFWAAGQRKVPECKQRVVNSDVVRPLPPVPDVHLLHHLRRQREVQRRHGAEDEVRENSS